MSLHTSLVPSEKIAAEAAQYSVSPALLMRDFCTFADEPDVRTIAVGDMANNLVGRTSHEVPELAAKHGLPQDYQFNIGLLGSRTLRENLGHMATTRSELIRGANETLRGLYVSLGMISVGHEAQLVDRAELATGYLAHARITPRDTIITGIGDVYVWLNGELVAGSEKEIDTLKTSLIDDLFQGFGEVTDKQSVLSRQVDHFKTAAQLDMDTSTELARRLQAADVADRQQIYRAVDDIVTPWQIRKLQNTENHPLSYGAIDGTETPESFIGTSTFPTADIETLVIATDGSKPAHNTVQGTEDLVAVSSKYGEQAIVEWYR